MSSIGSSWLAAGKSPKAESPSPCPHLIFDPGEELVMYSPERPRDIGCEELFEMALEDQGRGIADLRNG